MCVETTTFFRTCLCAAISVSGCPLSPWPRPDNQFARECHRHSKRYTLSDHRCPFGRDCPMDPTQNQNKSQDQDQDQDQDQVQEVGKGDASSISIERSTPTTPRRRSGLLLGLSSSMHVSGTVPSGGLGASPSSGSVCSRSASVNAASSLRRGSPLRPFAGRGIIINGAGPFAAALRHPSIASVLSDAGSITMAPATPTRATAAITATAATPAAAASPASSKASLVLPDWSSGWETELASVRSGAGPSTAAVGGPYAAGGLSIRGRPGFMRSHSTSSAIDLLRRHQQQQHQELFRAAGAGATAGSAESITSRESSQTRVGDENENEAIAEENDTRTVEWGQFLTLREILNEQPEVATRLEETPSLAEDVPRNTPVSDADRNDDHHDRHSGDATGLHTPAIGDVQFISVYDGVAEREGENGTIAGTVGGTRRRSRLRRIFRRARKNKKETTNGSVEAETQAEVVSEAAPEVATPTEVDAQAENEPRPLVEIEPVVEPEPEPEPEAEVATEAAPESVVPVTGTTPAEPQPPAETRRGRKARLAAFSERRCTIM